MIVRRLPHTIPVVRQYNTASALTQCTSPYRVLDNLDADDRSQMHRSDPALARTLSSIFGVDCARHHVIGGGGRDRPSRSKLPCPVVGATQGPRRLQKREYLRASFIYTLTLTGTPGSVSLICHDASTIFNTTATDACIPTACPPKPAHVALISSLANLSRCAPRLLIVVSCHMMYQLNRGFLNGTLLRESQVTDGEHNAYAQETSSSRL